VTPRKKFPMYGMWKAMISRCRNPNRADYPRYGGRGISVCQEWHDFSLFHAWAIASGYAAGLTIDRMDVNGNYAPDNCRWISVALNSRYKRTTRLTEDAAADIRARHASGESQLAIAERHGITRRHVNGICRNKAWADICVDSTKAAIAAFVEERAK